MVSPQIVIFSGGTATNELVCLFKLLTERICYILPILDNGGSTSEIIRVIGGPAIGDIRSRLTRLIPDDNEPLKKLLSFRLSANLIEAKNQWNQIVDGTHSLWADIDPATREIVRSFLVHVHIELLKRSKYLFSLHSANKQFRYELANIGNLFLTGARIFIGSLDSAVTLFARLTGIDDDTEVLPCINTNFSYHISALLDNGLIITGQSQISHPSENAPARSYPPPINSTRPPTPSELFTTRGYFDNANMHLDVPINDVALSKSTDQLSIGSYHSDLSSDEETGSIPQYTHPALKKLQLYFSKTESNQPLLSPIKRIFYISPYGEEILPIAYNRASSFVANSDVIIYSIGSLMTSIVPIVILKGIGRAIASDIVQGKPTTTKKKKIFLLNGCTDRETSGMDASQFIKIIFESATHYLNEGKGSCNINQGELEELLEWKTYVTHLVYMKGCKITVDKGYIEFIKGIKCIEVELDSNEKYDVNDLQTKLHNIVFNH